MFIKDISLKEKKIDDWERYPFNIPAVRKLGRLSFTENVTFLVGENGSGKSTIIEALAISLGFNPEGGSKNFSFATQSSHSNLHEYLKISRSFKQPKDGFFLRAESFYNLASNVDELSKIGGKSIYNYYGGKSLHEQSHGESFTNLVLDRFSEKSLFILDEPEAALSPQRQMTLLARMNQLDKKGSQFIIATHSPILLAYPGALIYQVSKSGIEQITYEDTEAYQITQAFLKSPERMFKELFQS